MRVEILSVGDEILYGTLVDTNTAYLAEQCQLIGLEVIRHSCVGDDLEQLSTILSEMSERADVALISGGLGPTLDDLSREAAAKAGGLRLELYPEALQAIKDIFKKLERSMPEANIKQAYFPKGSFYLANPIGTAPGFMLKINSTDFFFMPGVPREMKQMFADQILPKLLENHGEKLQFAYTKTINTFGISEAVLGSHLEQVAKILPQVKLGTRAILPEVQVKISVREANQKEAYSLLERAAIEVANSISDWIYSSETQTMPQKLGELLTHEKAQIAIAEIGCGGLLADWLTSVSNSGDFFKNSSVFNEYKALSLFPDSSSDAELTIRIAQQLFAVERAAFSIAINGIINDDSAKNRKAGTVYIAIADKNSSNCYSCFLPLGGVDYKKRFFAMLALDILRRQILKLDMPNEILGKPLCRCNV